MQDRVREHRRDRLGKAFQAVADPNARVEPDAANRTAAFDRANEEFGYPGETPLHRAARVIDTPAVMTALIEGGADPNARDDTGSTPLRLAEDNGNPAVLAAFIDAGP